MAECTSLLYFVVRVRCSRTESSRSLYHLLIIIIMWLVQSWTLPFVRACSMPVDSALGGRRLHSPMLNGARSDSTVRSQVRRGRPALRFQSLGRGATLALRARLWSMDGLARAIWPKYLRRVVRMMSVSSGWSVRRRTSSLEMRSLQDIPSIRRRHHWSKASRFKHRWSVRLTTVIQC